MPILTLKLSGQRSKETSAAVAATVAGLTHRILKKPLDLIAVEVEYVDHEDWIIGGKSLAELKQNSFFLDIKITDETNLKSEKAEFIREVFAALSTFPGNLHEKSYIHVEDVRAASYGYGGFTQEYRFHHKAA